jgi:hypothetical protein
MNTKRLQKVLSVLDYINFEDLIDLADHEEITNIQENEVSTLDPSLDPDFISTAILPADVRKFISDRANSNQRFRTGTIQTCPEAEFAKALTGSLEHTDGAIDLFIEPRTDIQIQVSVLQEVFPTIVPEGMMYFPNPDMGLTVMLSTWNTSMPLGSLHGHLGPTFEQFGHFRVFSNNAIAVYRKTDN